MENSKTTSDKKMTCKNCHKELTKTKRKVPNKSFCHKQCLQQFLQRHPERHPLSKTQLLQAGVKQQDAGASPLDGVDNIYLHNRI